MVKSRKTKWVALMLATGSLLAASACTKTSNQAGIDQGTMGTAQSPSAQASQQPGTMSSNGPSDQAGIASHSGGVSGQSGGMSGDQSGSSSGSSGSSSGGGS